jgi:hypothetical protein
MENPAEAAQIALSIAGNLGSSEHFRIAAHYGIARLADDPFSASQFATGCSASVPTQILLSTPVSAIHASEDFAAVLCAGPAAGRPRVEYIGDMPAERGDNSIRLFSLKR